jgi:hypothetical protein
MQRKSGSVGALGGNPQSDPARVSRRQIVSELAITPSVALLHPYRQRVLSAVVPSDAICCLACIITASSSRPMSSRRSAYLADS